MIKTIGVGQRHRRRHRRRPATVFCSLFSLPILYRHTHTHPFGSLSFWALLPLIRFIRANRQLTAFRLSLNATTSSSLARCGRLSFDTWNTKRVRIIYLRGSRDERQTAAASAINRNAIDDTPVIITGSWRAITAYRSAKNE